MFKVGEKVVHFTGLTWGTVVGYKEVGGVIHAVIRHEDPYYKNHDDGIGMWLPSVLRAKKDTA